jgi:hypothetical protein
LRRFKVTGDDALREEVHRRRVEFPQLQQKALLDAARADAHGIETVDEGQHLLGRGERDAELRRGIGQRHRKIAPLVEVADEILAEAVTPAFQAERGELRQQVIGQADLRLHERERIIVVARVIGDRRREIRADLADLAAAVRAELAGQLGAAVRALRGIALERGIRMHLLVDAGLEQGQRQHEYGVDRDELRHHPLLRKELKV